MSPVAQQRAGARLRSRSSSGQAFNMWVVFILENSCDGTTRTCAVHARLTPSTQKIFCFLYGSDLLLNSIACSAFWVSAQAAKSSSAVSRDAPFKQGVLAPIALQGCRESLSHRSSSFSVSSCSLLEPFAAVGNFLKGEGLGESSFPVQHARPPRWPSACRSAPALFSAGGLCRPLLARLGISGGAVFAVLDL